MPNVQLREVTGKIVGTHVDLADLPQAAGALGRSKRLVGTDDTCEARGKRKEQVNLHSLTHRQSHVCGRRTEEQHIASRHAGAMSCTAVCLIQRAARPPEKG